MSSQPIHMAAVLGSQLSYLSEVIWMIVLPVADRGVVGILSQYQISLTYHSYGPPDRAVYLRARRRQRPATQGSAGEPRYLELSKWLAALRAGESDVHGVGDPDQIRPILSRIGMNLATGDRALCGLREAISSMEETVCRLSDEDPQTWSALLALAETMNSIRSQSHPQLVRLMARLADARGGELSCPEREYYSRVLGEGVLGEIEDNELRSLLSSAADRSIWLNLGQWFPVMRCLAWLRQPRQACDEDTARQMDCYWREHYPVLAELTEGCLPPQRG